MDAFVVREMVGFELRNKREAQGLTLQQLADMAGTSYTHLWKIENAQVSVGLDLLCRIALALDAPLDEIVGPAWEKADLICATMEPLLLENPEGDVDMADGEDPEDSLIEM